MLRGRQRWDVDATSGEEAIRVRMRPDTRVRRPGGLTRRLIAASVLLAVIVGGGFAVVLLAVGDLRDAGRRTDRSQNVLIAANELERLLLDLETGQRGFMLTGQARFLEPWRTARADFPRRAAALVRLVAGNPAAERSAARIARSERAYITQYSVPLVEAARRGDPSARSVAATAVGKRRVDAMRVEFDRLLRVERRASAAAYAGAGGAARRASAAAAVGLAGSIALIALYAAYLRRGIVRPVRRAAGGGWPPPSPAEPRPPRRSPRWPRRSGSCSART